jgi:hypothetical protein
MSSSKHDKTRHPPKRERPLGDEHVSTVNMPPRPKVKPRLPPRSGITERYPGEHGVGRKPPPAPPVADDIDDEPAT